MHLPSGFLWMMSLALSCLSFASAPWHSKQDLPLTAASVPSVGCVWWQVTHLRSAPCFLWLNVTAPLVLALPHTASGLSTVILPSGPSAAITVVPTANTANAP